jgi:hypothetical protein
MMLVERFWNFAKCYSSDGLDDISTQSNIDMKVPAMSISPMAESIQCH